MTSSAEPTRRRRRPNGERIQERRLPNPPLAAAWEAAHVRGVACELADRLIRRRHADRGIPDALLDAIGRA